MPVFVLLTGVIMLLFGVAFLIAPSIVRHWFSRITVWKQFYPIAALRIVIGILFLVAAKETRFPVFVTVMGTISIVAGLALPVLGTERIRAFAKWGLERSDSSLRLWALAASAVGIMLVWAGL